MKLPIGDWSDDGHGKCDWFLIGSNLPVEEVREAYFKACDTLGEDLSDFLCSEYEDYEIPEEKLERLKELNLDISDLIDKSYYGEPCFYDRQNFAEFILRALNKLGNKDFAWKFLDEEAPMIPFYGFDDKKRHIGYFGYGLFS